jgi:hypothetical protein
MIDKIYTYSPIDRRISDSDVSRLGKNVPEFYRCLATNFGAGTVSNLFDIYPPSQCLADTKQTKPFLKEFEDIDASFFDDACICGNGLQGYFWFKPDGTIFTAPDYLEIVLVGQEFQAIENAIFSGNSSDRLVYDPWGERIRFVFEHPSHTSSNAQVLNFDETVSHFSSLGLCGFKMKNGTTEDLHQWAHCYFPSFGGALSIHRNDKRVSLDVGRDNNVGAHEFAEFLRHSEVLELSVTPHPHG